MRTLNQFERTIVNRIVNYHNQGILSNYASVIDHLLDNKDIYLDYNARTVEVRADVQFYNAGNLVDVVEQITAELVTTVNLLDDLEKNGYVTTYLQAANNGQIRYGQLVVGNQHIPYQFVDPDLVNMLLDCSFKTILVGQPLIDYVNNGFQTNDQVSQTRNIRIAVISLVASVIMSGAGLYFSYKGLDNSPTQIDQETIDKLTKPILTIDEQLDDIETSIDNSEKEIIKVLKEDTLKTRQLK
ncbi:MAG: hypothetical protein JJ895_04015 [Balneolaceae bacterium]|nr:hypothetical protein [Balneolaceae bacterium]